MSFLSPNRLKARLAPHLRWRVPYEAGIYANSPRWSNKGYSYAILMGRILLIMCALDLDPLPIDMRTWGGLVSSLPIRIVFPNVLAC